MVVLLLIVVVRPLEVVVPAPGVYQPFWPSVLLVVVAQQRVVPLDGCALLPVAAPPLDGAAPPGGYSLGILPRHSSSLVHVRAWISPKGPYAELQSFGLRIGNPMLSNVGLGLPSGCRRGKDEAAMTPPLRNSIRGRYDNICA